MKILKKDDIVQQKEIADERYKFVSFEPTEDYACYRILKMYRHITKTKDTKYEKALTDNDIDNICGEINFSGLKYCKLFNIFDSKNRLLNI